MPTENNKNEWVVQELQDGRNLIILPNGKTLITGTPNNPGRGPNTKEKRTTQHIDPKSGEVRSCTEGSREEAAFITDQSIKDGKEYVKYNPREENERAKPQHKLTEANFNPNIMAPEVKQNLKKNYGMDVDKYWKDRGGFKGKDPNRNSKHKFTFNQKERMETIQRSIENPDAFHAEVNAKEQKILNQ